jgi:hypothetical protein
MAEEHVGRLAEEVVLPLAHLLVLQHLVDGEAVEEHEHRHEDPVHEVRRQTVYAGMERAVLKDGLPWAIGL